MINGHLVAFFVSFIVRFVAEADAAMINGHLLIPKQDENQVGRGGRRGDDQWTLANVTVPDSRVPVAEADAAMINGHPQSAA